MLDLRRNEDIDPITPGAVIFWMVGYFDIFSFSGTCPVT